MKKELTQQIKQNLWKKAILAIKQAINDPRTPNELKTHKNINKAVLGLYEIYCNQYTKVSA